MATHRKISHRRGVKKYAALVKVLRITYSAMPNNAINSGRIAASLVEWHLAGRAQPLAVTMNEGVCLAVEVDPARIQRRLDTGYLDEMVTDLDEALRRAEEYKAQGLARSIGLLGNAAEVFPEIVRRGARMDLVTD